MRQASLSFSDPPLLIVQIVNVYMEQRKKQLLILASPKSASTSLLEALGAITGLDSKQILDFRQCSTGGRAALRLSRTVEDIQKKVFCSSFQTLGSSSFSQLRNISPCGHFYALSAFHSDICELDGLPHKVQSAVFSNSILKQHFPPTLNNIAFLKETPKILLLSQPDEIIQSYLRLPDNPYNCKAKKMLSTSEVYKNRLTEELHIWSEKWSECIDSSHIFTKHQLIEEPSAIYEVACSLMGVKINSDLLSQVKLPKKRVYRQV